MERIVLWKGKKVERTVNSRPFSQKLQTQVFASFDYGQITNINVEVYGPDDKVAMNLGGGVFAGQGLDILNAYRAFRLIDRLPVMNNRDVQNVIRLTHLPTEATARFRKEVEPLFAEEGMLDAMLKSVPPDVSELMARLEKQGVHLDTEKLCQALDAGLIKPSVELSAAGVRPKDERELMRKGYDMLEARFLPHIQALAHEPRCLQSMAVKAINAYLSGHDDTDVCVGIAIADHLMGPDLSEFQDHPFLGGLATELSAIISEVTGSGKAYNLTADFLAKQFASKGITAEAYAALLNDLVPKFKALKTIPTDRLKTVKQ